MPMRFVALTASYELRSNSLRAIVLVDAHCVLLRQMGSLSTVSAASPRGSPSKKAAQGQANEYRLWTFFRSESVRQVRTLQSANNSGLDQGACNAVKNIGKPCAGEPHARFDEGGLVEAAMEKLLRHTAVRNRRQRIN